MRLKVPLYRQPKNSGWCGPVSAQMVFAYFGIKIPASKLAKEAHYRKGYGTDLPSLGRIFLKYGFKTRLITCNASQYAPVLQGKSKRFILKTLQNSLKMKTKGFKKSGVQNTIKFIEEGGSFEFDFLSFTDIKKNLSKKQLIIARVEKNMLHLNSVIKNGWHFVVPVEVKNNSIVVNDPAAKMGGVRTIPKDQFLASFYTARGYALLIANS